MFVFSFVIATFALEETLRSEDEGSFSQEIPGA
jgi:hypothetical protein